MTELTPSELTFEIELDERPEKVWRALTIPAFVDRWLLPLEEAGGQGLAGKGLERKGFAGKPPALDKRVEVTVLDADPFRRLCWRWQEEGSDASLVTVTLAPRADGGTSLRLLHERRITAWLMPAPANGNTMMALAA